MTDSTEFRKLAERFSHYQSKVTEFPSGAAMLDLIIGGVQYTAEFFPTLDAYGLSRTDQATFGWEGVEETFATCEELGRAIDALCTAPTSREQSER